MIQRKQTIWLLLAAIAAFLVTRIPLFQGVLPGNVFRYFSATESLLIFALDVIAGLLAFVAIFLFKNRKLQLKLAVFGLLASIVLVALEVIQISNFKQENVGVVGNYYWGALFPIAMVILFFLAISGIRKDEKLIKSLERFR